MGCHDLVIEIAMIGKVKRTAKKSEAADFLVWSAIWLTSAISFAP